MGEIATSINDGIHFKPKYVQKGIKFVTAKNISSGFLNLENTDYITKSDYEEYKKKANPQKGDLLLSKDGTIGVAAIDNTNEKFGILSSVAVVRTSKLLILNKYLKAIIGSAFLQKEINKNVRGIAYRHWNLKRINNTLIALPPLNEQHRIVAKIDKLFQNIKGFN